MAGRTIIEDDLRVPRQTTIGERVFIGTGVSFLDEESSDKESRCHPETVLEDRCTVGAHAILYPGVCIGCRVGIAAGMVVKKNVSPDVCVSGNPVRFGRSGKLKTSVLFFKTYVAFSS